MMGTDAQALAGRDYRVGQDRRGRWLVMEREGRGGGMFASREAALRYAHSESALYDGAVVLAKEPIGFV